jgi:hypothetical protein
MRMPMLGKIHAPALPDGLVWLNSAPLSMEKLRGKPVLIDFDVFVRELSANHSAHSEGTRNIKRPD